MKYRQAHKLPPRRWELILFAVALATILLILTGTIGGTQ